MSKFNFANQKFMLTYKGHLEKEELIKFISLTIKCVPKFIRCAWETGKDGYKHTHLVCDVGKRFQSKNERIFDLGEIHPNIQPLKSITHFNNAVKYLSKEDPENKDLKKDERPIAVKVWESENLHEAVEAHVKSAVEVFGVKELWKMKQAEIKVEEPTFPWHKYVLDKIKGVPDKRKITWIYDKVGNTGKTWLTKYCHATKLAYAITACGGIKDFATMIESALEDGWDGKAVIFDLPRAAETKSIYEPLESIKNGLITVSKYKGRTIVLDNPHVIVMANFMPNLYALSVDRWDLREVGAGLTLLE